MEDNLIDLAGAMARTADILELAVTDPPAAADILEAWAGDLLELASALRTTPGDEYGDGRDPGGFADKVTACVIGPDGKLKSHGGS